ncbi:MAG: hypothetical protein HYS16_00265 [Deltaproteobacteria bacterium]|nr:MAG: hypothetical protein HYS16_00265 [Deltaproteobacteria bacterium]
MSKAALKIGAYIVFSIIYLFGFNNVENYVSNHGKIDLEKILIESEIENLGYRESCANMDLFQLVSYAEGMVLYSPLGEYFANIGRNHGVYDKDIVFNNGSIFGIVLNAQENYSQIAELSSPMCVINVSIPRIGIQAIMKGLSIDRVEKAYNISIGDVVYTEQEGVPVGRIFKASANTLYVEPFKCFFSLYIFVLRQGL